MLQTRACIEVFYTKPYIKKNVDSVKAVMGIVALRAPEEEDHDTTEDISG